ncbi:S-layer homology domain-containing protein [Selenihalanaerobacter shriftii]|uniref:S-layer homology domain-containing protein n=1 Tax=Selenihalanaerobacter shriftii TaxID=142842 RepID=A0A1T4KX39_9FIRM|nr:S-layer homology domain-containing protein [Selenihalanaerobacter shriftii]SJZ47004.1 S-layer homology domain-containing protein [Selenihalanaerobacter shriftii]
MKRIALLLTFIMLLTVAMPVLAANPFTDVPLGHWAYDAISKVAELGLMEGTPEGDFNGEESMTRYEMAVTTARIADMVEKKSAQLSDGQKKEVQQMLSALETEFSQELELVKAEVEQNKSDINTLKKKSETNNKLSIAAIVIAIIAAASN